MVTLALVVSAASLLVALLTLAAVWRLRGAVGGTDVDRDRLTAAVGETWREMGLDSAVDDVERHAGDISDFHADIEDMLRAPQARGAFGEQQLDVILADHLPPDAYGIRERVVEGATPDAHVDAPAGTICIDSKFPLDNYERYRDADDPAERERLARQFRGDVERQLEKVAEDYVRPAAGTAEFAIAFVPSEAVYYHLVTEEHDLLREYAGRGVQVVSPLTLGQKLELLRAGVRARRLSEQADAIREDLHRLRERFDAVEDEWSTLYGHLRNAKNRADDLDGEYDRLRDAFERVEEPGDGQADAGAGAGGDDR